MENVRKSNFGNFVQQRYEKFAKQIWNISTKSK